MVVNSMQRHQVWILCGVLTAAVMGFPQSPVDYKQGKEPPMFTLEWQGQGQGELAVARNLDKWRQAVDYMNAGAEAVAKQAGYNQGHVAVITVPNAILGSVLRVNTIDGGTPILGYDFDTLYRAGGIEALIKLVCSTFERIRSSGAPSALKSLDTIRRAEPFSKYAERLVAKKVMEDASIVEVYLDFVVSDKPDVYDVRISGYHWKDGVRQSDSRDAMQFEIAFRALLNQIGK